MTSRRFPAWTQRGAACPRTGGLVAWAKTDSTQAQLEALATLDDSVVFSSSSTARDWGCSSCPTRSFVLGAPAIRMLPCQFGRDLTRLIRSWSEDCHSNRRQQLRLGRRVDAGPLFDARSPCAALRTDSTTRAAAALLQSATLTTPDALPSPEQPLLHHPVSG